MLGSPCQGPRSGLPPPISYVMPGTPASAYGRRSTEPARSLHHPQPSLSQAAYLHVASKKKAAAHKRCPRLQTYGLARQQKERCSWRYPAPINLCQEQLSGPRCSPTHGWPKPSLTGSPTARTSSTPAPSPALPPRPGPAQEDLTPRHGRARGYRRSASPLGARLRDDSRVHQPNPSPSTTTLTSHKMVPTKTIALVPSEAIALRRGIGRSPWRPGTRAVRVRPAPR